MKKLIFKKPVDLAALEKDAARHEREAARHAAAAERLRAIIEKVRGMKDEAAQAAQNVARLQRSGGTVVHSNHPNGKGRCSLARLRDGA